MDKKVFVEYYSGSDQATICKVVNSGGDMKTLMVPADELEGLIAQLQDARARYVSSKLDKARSARMDSLS